MHITESSGVVYACLNQQISIKARVQGSDANMLPGVSYALPTDAAIEVFPSDGTNSLDVVHVTSHSAPSSASLQNDLGLQAFKKQFAANASEDVLEELEQQSEQHPDASSD